MTITKMLEALPADRRQAIETVRRTILANLPAGYEEATASGMLVYQVPLRVYPNTYNKQPLMYAALASQKSYMALYLCNAYAMPAVKQTLEEGFRAAGKKLDMGKSCIRFKRLEDLPLDVVAQAVAATPLEEYVAYDRSVHSKEATAARRARRSGQ